MMSQDFTKEFKEQEQWAYDIRKVLGHKEFKLGSSRKMVIEDAILCTTFTVYTELPAGTVTEAIVETGKRYKRGRRYFFIFDKGKKILFLLFYPYYTFCDREGRNNK